MRMISPSPGRISGVGALVEKVWRVGVADGGNQIMVAVGSGVSVGVGGMGVARNSSSAAQEESNPAMIIMEMYLNIMDDL